MYYIAHAVLWDAYCLSYLVHIQSTVYKYKILEFCPDIVIPYNSFVVAPEQGSSNTDVRLRGNLLNQLLLVATEAKDQQYTTSKNILIWLRKSLRIQESNHRPIFLFFALF